MLTIDWPRIRFTTAMLAAVTLGFILGIAEATLQWHGPRQR